MLKSDEYFSAADAPIFRPGLSPWFVWVALVAAAGLAAGVIVGKGDWRMVAALLALPIVLARPIRVALGLFVLLIPFDSVAVFGSNPSGRTLTWYAGLAAIIILLTKGLVNRRFLKPPRAATWWTLFIIWCSITTAWALNWRLSFGRFSTAWALLAFFLVAVSIRISRSELLWISVLAILGGCLAGAYMAQQFYSGSLFHEGMINTRGSLIVGERQTDPNYFAGSLLLPISLAIGLFLTLRAKLIRAGLALAIGLMSLAIFLTMSRGALVALGFVVCFYVYRLRASSRRIITVAAVFIALAAILPSTFWQRVQPDQLSGLSGRVSIWTVGLKLIGHYGLFGAGLDNFPVAYAGYAGYAPTYAGISRSPHNVYFNVWIEMGVLGLLLFFAAVWTHFRDARKSIAPAGPGAVINLIPYQAACWALLIDGLSVDLLWTKVFWLAWILLALAVRCQQAEVVPGVTGQKIDVMRINRRGAYVG